MDSIMARIAAQPQRGNTSRVIPAEDPFPSFVLPSRDSVLEFAEAYMTKEKRTQCGFPGQIKTRHMSRLAVGAASLRRVSSAKGCGTDVIVMYRKAGGKTDVAPA